MSSDEKKVEEEEEIFPDQWKEPKITPEDVQLEKGPLILEQSSFSTLFPQYRELYLKQVWPEIKKELKAFGIDGELDLVEGSMTVQTTRKTFDPFIIMKARDCIKLLARSVPYQQALRVLQDDIVCDIVKIGNLTRNKDKFVKRRQRLIGPNGKTLKAIELLTGCYVLVQGSTVSAIGSYKGIKLVRTIAEDCIKNIHPVYHIKELMIKRELAKDPKLKTESWDRFLPQFKKRNIKRKTSKDTKSPEKKKKEYTPFPPAQTPRKEDIAMETGEFFLSAEEKKQKENEELTKKKTQKMEEKKKQRMQQYIAPEEPRQKKSESKKVSVTEEVQNLASKFKATKEEKVQKRSAAAEDLVDAQPKKKKKTH
eukprot:c16172_g1_i1.p1 GENE.c16172_g1_i1~~c16172_g1_i1.p1  ORF type:complete len:375 (-),score=148.90 c16172_g1_i1:85-1185(-)